MDVLLAQENRESENMSKYSPHSRFEVPSSSRNQSRLYYTTTKIVASREEGAEWYSSKRL